LSATPTAAKQTALLFATIIATGWPDFTSTTFTDVNAVLGVAIALDVTTIP
jgi:hypothetical protein